MRLSYEQYANWHNALLLNPHLRGDLGALRRLYARILRGQQYGQYSGYSP